MLHPGKLVLAPSLEPLVSEGCGQVVPVMQKLYQALHDTYIYSTALAGSRYPQLNLHGPLCVQLFHG